MYSGKYQKPVRKRKNRKKPGILIVSLVMLFVVIVGGSVAFLQDTTNKVENTFTPAKVEVTINEKTTDNSKSNITFTNTGNVSAYIRATLVVYWEDSKGNIVAPPANGSVKVDNTDIYIVQPLGGWTRTDGEYIFYYNSIVEPGGETTPMLGTISINCPEGYKCFIDVRAEAIQAEGMNATSAQDAWAKAANNSGV